MESIIRLINNRNMDYINEPLLRFACEHTDRKDVEDLIDLAFKEEDEYDNFLDDFSMSTIWY